MCEIAPMRMHFTMYTNLRVRVRWTDLGNEYTTGMSNQSLGESRVQTRQATSQQSPVCSWEAIHVCCGWLLPGFEHSVGFLGDMQQVKVEQGKSTGADDHLVQSIASSYC